MHLIQKFVAFKKWYHPEAITSLNTSLYSIVLLYSILTYQIKFPLAHLAIKFIRPFQPPSPPRPIYSDPLHLLSFEEFSDHSVCTTLLLVATQEYGTCPHLWKFSMLIELCDDYGTFLGF